MLHIVAMAWRWISKHGSKIANSEIVQRNVYFVKEGEIDIAGAPQRPEHQVCGIHEITFGN